MRTVGELLKETREAKLYTLEDVEKHTKIRKELVEALERDDYKKLPPATFVQGFIKNYGSFLGLDENKLLALFRRDFEAKKHPPVILESFKKPIGAKKVILTPSRIFGLCVVLIVFCFFAYLWVEYRQFIGAPNLLISSPQDQQTVDIPTIFVEGETDPEAKVTINSQEINVDKSGHFKEEIKLSSSSNIVSVVATSRFGQMTKVDKTVFVKK